jgi:N6-adenosine-specific RNA methylase IME4
MSDLFPVEDQWRQLRESFARLIVERPAGGYRLLLTDWPWAIEMRSAEGLHKSPQRHYDCIPTDIIESLPWGMLAGPDSVCLQWSTAPMLPAQLRVLERQGFEYKTIVPWYKGSKLSDGEPGDETWKANFGTGYIFRNCSEFLVVATRGRPILKPERLSLRAAFFAPVRAHSQKPDQQYTHAEALSPGPWIELFSRTDRPGWKHFGDMAGKFGEAR